MDPSGTKLVITIGLEKPESAVGKMLLEAGRAGLGSVAQIGFNESWTLLKKWVEQRGGQISAPELPTRWEVKDQFLSAFYPGPAGTENEFVIAVAYTPRTGHQAGKRTWLGIGGSGTKLMNDAFLAGVKIPDPPPPAPAAAPGAGQV